MLHTSSLIDVLFAVSLGWVGETVSVCWKWQILRYTFMMNIASARGCTSSVPGPRWNPVLLVSLRPDHAPMPENRSHAQSKRPATPREYFLPVEVYISNQAAAALRKVPLHYLIPTYCPICRSQNSPIRGRRQRKESLRELCPF